MLIAIIANQALWIVNMYNGYKKEIYFDINKGIENAVYREMTERGESGGGFSAFSLYTENGDTSRYIKKTIIGEDHTLEVEIDRQDPNANMKIVQSILRNVIPLSVSRVNEFFFQEMQHCKFSIEKTYVEHYDLKRDSLMASSSEGKLSVSYISSDTMKIDIMEDMGVIAYVNNPVLTILRGMIIQLLLSILLIIVAVIGMFYLGRTIFRQWKEEKMRQDSVNAMTHEFKRPINAALGLVSRIPDYLKKSNIEKVIQYVELTMDELNRLSAYTQRIQQISNNDKSTINLDKSEIEMRSFLESLTAKFHSTENLLTHHSVYRKTTKMNLNVLPEHPVIWADRIHLANVVDNLIENAIKYSNEYLEINLTVDYQDTYMRMSIKDNGIGIGASDIKRIFDKFYRVNSRAVKRKTGIGLGLTYVKSIVEAHGGRIEVRSQGLGYGSEFIVLMPIDNRNGVN